MSEFQPTLSAQHSDLLGPKLHLFRSNGAVKRNCIIWGSAFIVAAIGFLVAAFLTTMWLAIATVLLLIGGGLQFAGITGQYVVQLHQNGFLEQTQGKEPSIVLWDSTNICEVQMGSMTKSSTDHTLIFEPSDSRAKSSKKSKVVVECFDLTGGEKFYGEATVRTTNALHQTWQTKLKNGETVSFGKVSFNASGVNVAGAKASWQSLTQFTVDSETGNVTFTGEPKKKCHSGITMAKFTNLFPLAQFAEKIVKAASQSSLLDQLSGDPTVPTTKWEKEAINVPLSNFGKFFLIAIGASVLICVIFSWYNSGITRNATGSDKIFHIVLQGAVCLVSCLVASFGFAPEDLLKSKKMVGLMKQSGVETITKFRIVIFGIAFVGFVLLAVLHFSSNTGNHFT